MKSFLNKTIDTLTFGTLRRQRTETEASRQSQTDSDGATLLSSSIQGLSVAPTVTIPDRQVPPVIQLSDQEECANGWSIYGSSPSPETFDEMEDDILYRKNNVYLKYPSRRRAPTGESGASTVSGASTDAADSFLMKPLVDHTPSSSLEDKEGMILIPGYMSVATRGSDFGQTLILNWTPNAVMDKSLGSGGTSLADRPSCSSVSIDLGQMESIRVFYQLDTHQRISGGEMVISTRERHFKMFYFKHGGLYDLVKKFRSWKFFNYEHETRAQQYMFTVFRPRLSLAELHPDEGVVCVKLTERMWDQLHDPKGRILDQRLVLQTVFFRGLQSSLRCEVWPYLLGLLEFDMPRSTVEAKRKEWLSVYKQINAKREALMSSGECKMANSTMELIKSDIRRTDRTHPFYQGDNNPNLLRLENILLNYLLIYRPDISYCQGMTDYLSPLLITLDNDADSFFCFTSLVEGSAFFKPARNRVSLKRQVTLLKALIEILIPWFHAYLLELDDGMALLYTHRWLLVCLKREFKLEDTLCVWEACWTNYTTNSFYLFICVAIMAMYGQRALDQEMGADELMVHFNSLANAMPVEIVLSQARGYLHQFTKTQMIPCSLRSIMPDEFWETASSTGPRLVCQGGGACCQGMSLSQPPVPS